MPSSIVVDKCFLDGAPKARVRELATTHRLVISESLLYELLTGREPQRSRSFAKLPQLDNPVDLVNHIGTLMRIEIDTQKPAGKPSTHRDGLQFRFNSALMTGNYALPKAARDVIDEQFRSLQADVITFVERATTINSFFPQLLVGSQERRQQTWAETERTITTPGSLLDFYASLEPPLGDKGLPPAAIVDDSWALYRWLQVQFLFGVDLYVRYQGRVPRELSPAVFERLEHDVLDAQLLMLACLEGAFATREKKLQRWWKLLCPDGALFE